MASVAFCIYCDSLDVTETVMNKPQVEAFYEYFCYTCKESWTDDESEYEFSV